MIGKPKYNINDEVEFDIQIEDKNYVLIGKIFIIDKYGTFEQNDDVSYDIMVDHLPLHDNEPCLFKHIIESDIRKH